MTTPSIDPLLFYNNNVDNVSDVWVILVHQSDGKLRPRVFLASRFLVLVELIRLYVINSRSIFIGILLNIK